MTVFRPPRLPKNLAALEPAFQAIYEDIKRLALSPGDVSIKSTTYAASAGETVRVSPPPEGMGLVLPPPTAENRSQVITAIIESPDGDLRVFVSPKGDGTTPTIDGQEMASYSEAGTVRWVSNGADKWSDARGAAGATGATGATGPAGAAGADSAMRRIRRHVFYADGTCDIIEDGVTTNVALTSFGLEADGNAYKAWIVAGGTSGTRGGRLAALANAAGSSGVGGASVAERLFHRAELEDFIAALGTDIPVTVGAGGPSVAAVASGTGVQGHGVGTLGGVTSFGTLLVAHPGGRGSEITPLTSAAQRGGAGGGWLSAGADTGGAANIPGAPSVLSSSTTHRDGNFGGGRGATGGSGADNAAGAGVYGGGGGGGGPGTGAADSTPGGQSALGVPGAGAGGGLTSGGTARAGSAAGRRGFNPAAGQEPVNLSGGGPAGGAGATGAGPATDGADGADGVLGLYPGESGGGGGALNCTSGSGSSGRGGDGGFPGGCGGSSGSVVANGGSPGIARSGAGANGVAVIDTLG